MSNVGSIDVQITADIASLQTNLRQMQNQLNGASQVIARNTSGIANSFQNMAQNIAASIKTYIIYKGLDLITNGVADTVKVYNDMASASLGLESILGAQGRSFASANGFIQEYVNDGLVPLNDAITAYKSLAARGYDDTQIESTLARLKDAAAFGRQSSLSIGEAVRGAAEGLKNENSMLVDNAGITKNVAKMWEEYAKSIGTNSQALTQQQKIQAEVNGIMKESQFQVGDAARYSETLGGKLSALGAQFVMLKGAIGSIFAPALQAILPTLSAMVTKMTELATSAGKVMAILFGIKPVTVSTTKAADAQKALATNMKAAGKAAKDNLQSFDELHTLQKDMTGSTDTLSNSLGGEDNATANSVTTETKVVVDPESEAALEGLRLRFEALKMSFEPTILAFGRLQEAIKPLTTFVFDNIQKFYTDTLKPIGVWVLGEGLPNFIDITANMLKKVDYPAISQALDALYKSISPFAVTIGEGLLWFYEKVLTPVGLYVTNKLLPPFLDSMSSVIKILGSIIEANKPLLTWVYDTWLVPLATWTGGIVASALTEISNALKVVSDWCKEHEETIAGITGVVVTFFAAWQVVNLLAFIQMSGGIISAFGLITSAIWASTGAIVANKLQAMYLQLLYAGDFIKSIWAVTRATWLGNAAMLAMPWVLAVAGVAALSAGFVYLMEDNARFRKSIADSIGGLSIFIDTIYNGAIVAFNNFRMTILDLSADAGSAMINNFINPVIRGLNKLIELSNKIAGTSFTTIAEIKFNSLQYSKDISAIIAENKRLASESNMLARANAISAEVDNFFATRGKDPNSVASTINRLTGNMSEDVAAAQSQIPKLASGGITTGPTTALIGEGQYKEAVIPLGGPVLDELMGGIANAVVQAMGVVSSGSRQSGDIILQVDGKTFARVVNPFLESEQKRSNTRIVVAT